MGFLVTRIDVPFRKQLWAAWVVRCAPWYIGGVRRLLTNPDVIEIYVRHDQRAVTYCFNPPAGYRWWHRIDRRPVDLTARGV